MKTTKIEIIIENNENEDNTKIILDSFVQTVKEHNIPFRIEFFTPINDIGEFVSIVEKHLNKDDGQTDKKESIDENEHEQ